MKNFGLDLAIQTLSILRSLCMDYKEIISKYRVQNTTFQMKLSQDKMSLVRLIGRIKF